MIKSINISTLQLTFNFNDAVIYLLYVHSYQSIYQKENRIPTQHQETTQYF